MPPPPAPSLWATSFQTTSETIVPAERSPTSVVPPQASACGEEAGKSACAGPLGFFGLSLDPLSPAAAVTVTPSAAASWNAWSIAVRLCFAHCGSGPPQLIEITVGVGVACTAVDTASMNPWSLVLVAKYTTWVAPGATAPATSMSSATSPSEPLSWPGEFDPPPTGTALTDGVARPSPLK